MQEVKKRKSALAWESSAMALNEEIWAERKQAKNPPATLAGRGIDAATLEAQKSPGGYFEDTGRDIENAELRPV